MGSAAAAYDLARGTYFDLMHAMSPEIRETHYILALEDVAAPPLAAMAVDLAHGRAVMVVAPHGIGLASSIERAGVVVTVVAPATGVVPCALSELRDHHAHAVAQGIHVGVVVGAWPYFEPLPFASEGGAKRASRMDGSCDVVVAGAQLRWACRRA